MIILHKFFQINSKDAEYRYFENGADNIYQKLRSSSPNEEIVLSQ